MLFVLVSLSILGLCVGASLVALGRVRASAASALDGLILGMIPALVLARLLPHTFESLGGWALGLAALGFGLVSLSQQAGEHTGLRLTSALVIPALWLHAVTDGAALAMSSLARVDDGSGLLLAAAVILHRVPEGLFVAARRRRGGLPHTLWPVVPLALATLLGALLGQRLFDVLPDAALDAVLALGSGAMLRLVGHSHVHSESDLQPSAAKAIAGVASLAGLAVVLAIPGPDDVLDRAQPRELAMAVTIVPLFIESAPAILLGLGCVSALRVAARSVLTPGALQVRGRLAQALRGLMFGWLQPLHSAGVVSATQRLLQRGVPAAAVLAFTAATAGFGVDTALLSWRLLGGTVTAGLWVGASLIALLAALVGAAWARTRNLEHPAQPLHPHSQLRARWREALTGWLDHNAAWLVFGLLLSAALEAALTPDALRALGAPWDIALAAALALPGYVCALGALPVAAVLLHKGASLGAVATLLWLAPLLNVSLSRLLRDQLGTRAVAAFVVGSVLLAMGFGVAVDGLVSTRDVPAVHPLIAHRHASWELACALLLLSLLLQSLLRLGPRGLAASMTAAPQLDAAVPHVHRHAAVHADVLPQAAAYEPARESRPASSAR